MFAAQVFKSAISRAVATLVLLAWAPSSAAYAQGLQATPGHVVIYYANETTQRATRSENYTTVLSTLRNSTNPIAATIADSIVYDSKAFPAAVQRDADGLLVAAKRWGFDLVVFTNTLVDDSRYLFYRHATKSLETRRFPALPKTSNAILETSPLSRTDYFRAALLQVGSLYPSTLPDAILITNSHGSKDLALTPRVFADLSVANASELLELLDGPSPQGGGRPSWAVKQGTTKRDFWPVIADVSVRTGMQFSLVFRAACVSGVASWEEFRSIPDSVREIAHTGNNNIQIGEIDFDEIFNAQKPDLTVLQSLTSELENRGIYINSPGTVWVWVVWNLMRSFPHIWFFAPLALWLLWYGMASFLAYRRDRADI